MQFVWSLPSPSTPHPPIAPPRPATCTRCLPSLPSVYSLPPFPPVCVLSLYLTEFFLDLNFLSTARWRIFFTLHHLYPYSLFSPPPPSRASSHTSPPTMSSYTQKTILLTDIEIFTTLYSISSPKLYTGINTLPLVPSPLVATLTPLISSPHSLTLPMKTCFIPASSKAPLVT